MEIDNDLTPATIEDRKEVVIRVSDLTKFLKRFFFPVIVSGAIFSLIGAGYSFLLPFEFNSTARILPELQSKSSVGGFRALADLAGINLDNMQVSEAIRPDLYPTVLQSKPFLLSLAKLKIQAADTAKEETVEQFLGRQVNPMHSITLKFFKSSSEEDQSKLPSNSNNKKIPSEILILSRDQELMLGNLKSRIKTDLDKKTGIILIDISMPDPIVAAWVAQYSIDYLKEYMLKYRSGKKGEEAEFLGKQRDIAKARFQSADLNLRSYKDRNRNPFNSSSTSDESRLQSEVQIAQNLYSELSKQAEQAQIKMREEIRVLQVLDPPQVALKRSSPKRTVIVLTFFIVGCFISLGYNLIKNY